MTPDSAARATPLRVALLDSIPQWGGGEKWCVEAATALRARGHFVVIVGEERGALVERAQQAGLEAWRLRLSGARGLAAGFELGRRLAQARVEVVVANIGRDVRIGAVACARSGARLVQRRGIARRIKRDPLSLWLYRRWVRRVIVNCAAIRDEMLRGGRAIGPERFAVIENGVEAGAPGDRAGWRARHGVAADAPLAVVVGRLAPMKGHAHLLRAWRSVLDAAPNARLAIVGEGELRAELEATRAQLGLGGSVLFTGFVREPADVYAAADLFVLPSVRDEGCNNALLEAMARGLPAVVTTCGGLPESVVEGATGRIVPLGDEAALGRAVAELLADPAARARMGATARARASERYSVARVTDELERVLRDVRGEGG